MSKRILALVALVALLMSIFAFTTTAAAYYKVYSACPNGKPLHVRSGPGKTYTIIDNIPYGGEIYVAYRTGDWLALNDIGYVQASLTTTKYPGTKPAHPTTSGDSSLNGIFKKAVLVSPYIITLKTVRASDTAKLRWAPSKSSTLLRAYPAGSQLTVIATMGDWYQVKDEINGVVGFINKAYIAQ